MNVRKRAAEHEKPVRAGGGSRYINTEVCFKDEINKEIHFILKGLQVDTCREQQECSQKNVFEFQNLNWFIENRKKKNLSVKGHQSSFVVHVD